MRPLVLMLLWGLASGLAAASTPAAAPTPALTPAATPEKLAGEERAVPTALPTPAGDERGPVSATRSAQAAPAFSLPAFIVTGGGERKVLANREDLGQGLDTSGGLKTSPGERGAGKDQREAQASRESAQDRSYTARADYARLGLAYGLANTLDANLLAALSAGPWFAWGGGQGGFSDGGPGSAAALHPALSRGGGGDLHVGWRGSEQDVVDASVAGEDRRILWTHGPLADPWIGFSDLKASLGWDGRALGTDWRARISDGRWQQEAPGLVGGTLGEDETGVSVNAARSLYGSTGSALLEAGLKVSSLRQSDVGTRSLWQGQGWLQSRFEAWPGNRLGLGLQWDQVGGDSAAMLLGPRVSLEQRLGRDLGLQASFGTGLGLSRLGGDEALAGQPWRPDPALAPSRRVADVRAGLRWRADGLKLALAGAYTQDQAADLPDDSSGAGLWVDSAVGTLERTRLTLKQRWEAAGWWQDLELGLQRADLPDRPGWRATFSAPYWARVGVGASHGALSGRLELAYLGPREVSLSGAEPALAAAWDLGAKAAWKLGPGLSVFLDGRNLLSQPVMDHPDYAQAAPYAGLGVDLSF